MFDNIEGKRIPEVTFRTRRDHEWVELTSKDIFEGKTVVVFSLPGAFTPTCSSAGSGADGSYRCRWWLRC